MQKIFCLIGQTATGKTEIAAKLSKQFPFKIISVDSSTIYKNMDVGTAKPSKSLLNSIPHKLVDKLSPESYYSVNKFVKDAHKEISSILKSGYIPLLVGGTMMYFYALQSGANYQPQKENAIFDVTRNSFHKKLKDANRCFLHTVDGRINKKINLISSRHVEKLLEIYISTGRNLTEKSLHSCLQNYYSNYDYVNIGIKHNNYYLLHKRIQDRLHLMLEGGLIKEVKSLKSQLGLSGKTSSAKSIAYKQVWEYLDNHHNLTVTKEKIVKSTIGLAKQQKKWMNRLTNIKCFSVEDVDLYKRITRVIKKTVFI